MKKCSNCNATYDDSWNVCLHCEIPLSSNGEQKPRSVTLGDNFIKKQISRTNRNLLLTNIGILIAAGWLLINSASTDLGPLWVLFLIGVGGVAIWNIYRFWKRSNNPTLHPIGLTLAKYGPLDKVIKLIDEEVKTPVVEASPVIVTNSWLFKTSFYSMEMILLGDLAWIYNRVTTHYTNGVKSGESYSIVINKRNGKKLEISCGQHVASLLLARCSEAAPWAVFGYNDGIQKLWDTNRDGFIEHVNQRKLEANRKKQ